MASGSSNNKKLKKPDYIPSQRILSQKGYAILKENNKAWIDYFTELLTVTPKVNPDSPGASTVRPFPVYRENSKKFYIPRALGFELFGAPTINKLQEGIDCSERLQFQGSLRPEQLKPVHAFLKAAEDPTKKGGIISLQCGGGKCLGINTPIIMFDGTIKKVQDIEVGDYIMGDDSIPRKVLSTCTGRERLYLIQQMKGDNYVVNESHILSLLNSKGHIIDICVKDYVSNKEYEYKPMYGYKASVEFSKKNIARDPYSLGLELNEKYTYIPYEYKCNTYEIRFEVFNGLVKANKYLIADHFAIFYINTESLANDVLFMVRSLGLICYKKYIFSENKFKLFVYKNTITPIKIKKLEKGTYYGFEIDGNHRFLLGDFTVTHNTVCGLNIVCELKKKTLIICHKEFLLNQWKERIQQFIPTAYVGLIKAQTIKVDNYDIVLGSLQSISMKEYDPEIFKQFGVVLFDEVHHLSAETFSQAMPKVTAPIFLGLSATLNRKDGLRKVFEWFIGKVVNDIIVRDDKALLVKMIKYYDTVEDYGVERFLWNGKKNSAAMITDICSYIPRIKKIVDEYILLITKEPERKTLILSGRREHLTEIEKELKRREYKSIGYYVGGMKEVDLKKSETCDIILATYSMAAEGMDIPVLNTLILASPIGDIEQAVGRIQRQKPHERKYVPYIIEIWDQYSLFQIQGLRHIRFYKKNGYSFITDDNAKNNVSPFDKSELYNNNSDDDADINNYNNDMKKINSEKKNNQKYEFIEDD